MVMTNMGEDLPVVFTGHHLTPGRTGGILYAPSQPDDAAFRADLAALSGLDVDYFDARIGTPDVSLLLDYSCVYTWVNYAYADVIAMHNNLADYVDAGGKVVLGQWCLCYTGSCPTGRIMDPDEPYLPVSGSSYGSGTYAGDGTGCFTADVTSYSTDYRDNVTLVPGAVTDGTYTDGVPFIANNPGIAVAYAVGALPDYSTGDIAEIVYGCCNCLGGEPVFGACCDDANGSCDDGVEQLDCLAVGGRFAADTTCADLDPPCSEPCDVVCDPTATPEGEPICYDGYEDFYNGGCNSVPPIFQPIACGETICGTSGVFNCGPDICRDTDWFERAFFMEDCTVVTWEATAEFPVQILIIDAGSGDCLDYTVIDGATAPACGTASVTATVGPGTYWFWVGPSDWLPEITCGVEYQATLTCDPCTASGCATCPGVPFDGRRPNPRARSCVCRSGSSLR